MGTVRARVPAASLGRIPALPGRPMAATLQVRRDRLRLLERMWPECGPIGRFRIGWRQVVVITDGALAREVLVDKAEAFTKGRTLGEFARPFLGTGLLSSEGDLHRRQRRLLAPVFPHRRVAGWVPDIAARTEQAQAAWADGRPVDVAREMTRLTLAVVASTLFGSELSAEVPAFAEAVTEANRYVAREAVRVAHPPPWLPTPASVRNRRALRTLDATVYRLIARRRADPAAGDDLLSILVGLRDEEDGSGMSDRQVRDEVMTLLFAGHETTANALAWAWHLLAANPGHAAALRAEADAVLGDRALTADDLARLPLALAVFKESLRVWPPVYLATRIPREPVEIGGHAIPAGTVVGINIWGMHHRPDVFPEPLRFDPGRFAVDRGQAIPRDAFLPFASGPRVCIGNQFALLEGQVVLATLARRVAFEPVDGRAVTPEPLITLRMRDGLPMTVRRR